MRYQLTGDWPVQHHLAPIPAGTVIDTASAEWAFLAGRPPPPNAMALDQEAYDELLRSYGHDRVLTPAYGNDIRRHGDP